MGSGFGSCIFFFFLHALLLLQYLSATNSREIKEGDSFTGVDKNLQMSVKHEMKYEQDQKGRDEVKIKEENHQKMIKEHILDQHSLPHAVHMDPNDPRLQVFFTVNDLKAGEKIPVYFPVKDPSTIPPLLSGKEADSIPFSSAHLPQLLELFSFSDGSPQAKAMESTLEHCEFAAMKGETKFCATSLESLLDSVCSIFGSNAKFKVLTTNHLTKTTTSSLLQNYTILGTPKEISVSRIIGCHPLPYPYAVYYCHSQVSDNKLFKVSLLGENGSRIEAAAMCHTDTSQWNRDHVAFMVLKTEPGKSPVCHFFPADNLVWIPSSSESI